MPLCAQANRGPTGAAETLVQGAGGASAYDRAAVLKRALQGLSPMHSLPHLPHPSIIRPCPHPPLPQITSGTRGREFAQRSAQHLLTAN